MDMIRLILKWLLLGAMFLSPATAGDTARDQAINGFLALEALEDLEHDERSKKRKRTVWVADWLGRRERQGAYLNLLVELREEDPEKHRLWIRMDTDTFYDLLHRVEPLITKQNTTMRDAISAGERLALTLRYLATGAKDKPGIS